MNSTNIEKKRTINFRGKLGEKMMKALIPYKIPQRNQQFTNEWLVFRKKMMLKMMYIVAENPQEFSKKKLILIMLYWTKINNE